jgi:hypothetical protein
LLTVLGTTESFSWTDRQNRKNKTADYQKSRRKTILLLLLILILHESKKKRNDFFLVNFYRNAIAM